MKRLMLTAATLAALTILMPAATMAQHLNQVGIYTDMVGTPAAANYDATPNTPFDVYLVLTNPTNFTFNGGTGTEVAVTDIAGFEAKITWPDSPAFFKTAEAFPAQAIDAASEADEYAMGFATNVPVSGGAVVLATFTLLVTTTDPFQVFLSNIRFDSIDGEMAFVDANDPNSTDWQDGNLAPMWGSTGGTANPVFSINDDSAVAIEDQSWGAVKALFN
ncbi:hypothetical protein KDM41_08490 [bacterium]|nr:hypothetical protein [bacterium]